MIHPTPTKVLLTTTCEPLVRQLSGSLAHGVRLIEPFLHDEPTPTTTMIFEWMRSQSYQRQKLPRGSGMTEAACKVVFTQRLKRSGMSWTIAGGQVILDLRVMRLSRVWDAVHRRYFASKPLPVTCVDTAKAVQQQPLAA
jgi:hypothetical protein